MTYIMADLTNIHPDLAKRFTRLKLWAESNDWQMGITSGYRNYFEQLKLYQDYITGASPILAVNPNVVTGRSPWGWDAKGSLHQLQHDGYSHALDIWWIGTNTATIHNKAYQFGLQFVNSAEAWHTQWWDFRSGIFPVIEMEEEDVTVDEFRKSTGLVVDPDNPTSGVLGVMLLENVDPPTYKWYDFATALIFIHQELKLSRLT